MQITRRLEKLEQAANSLADGMDSLEECSCEKVIYYPYDLYIKCANPHPAHPKPCYRDWLNKRLVGEQRTVVKGKCAECEAELGYLWDMTNTPDAEREIVIEGDPHRMDDIHKRFRLVRDGFLDFVDWPIQEKPNDGFKYTN